MQNNSESESCSYRRPNLNKCQETHTEEKSSCQVSESGFSVASYLEEYVGMHKVEKHIHCQVCGSVFSHANRLNEHMQRHAEASPFSCTMCGKTFSQYYNLKEHLRVHKDRNRILVKNVDKNFHKVLH